MRMAGQTGNSKVKVLNLKVVTDENNIETKNKIKTSHPKYNH